MKKQKIHLKSPFGYYGGKQRLAQRIISLIPKHTTYIEPFFGGGAIYFGKEPSSVEIINDTNTRQYRLNLLVRRQPSLIYSE